METILLNKIVEDYKNGDSLRKLDERYNYSFKTIHYHLNKKGILRKVKLVKSIKNNNPLLIGTFIGLWAGDGSKFMDRWEYIIKIHLNKNDEELLKFIKKLYEDLFDRGFYLMLEKGTNKAAVRFGSKFVYNFIDKYLIYERNKTLTIRLKNNINNYSNNFLKGFLLGLTLSDGCIKSRFVLTSISKNLIDNVYEIFKKFGYSPMVYKYPPHGYGKHDCYELKINRIQTIVFREFLNRLIINFGLNTDISRLKNYN